MSTASRISQVLDNLFSNAIEYSPADSVISVELFEDANPVTFSLFDRSCDIPRARRERVCDRFTRGLGLFILLVARNGKIRLNSRTGEGTGAASTLPKEKRSLG